MINKDEDMKKMLLKILEDYFGSDVSRIDHAKRVLRFAEELLAEEPADPVVVIAAAVLHDVGIKAAEEKYGASTGKRQEEEGPPIVRSMLTKLDYRPRVVDEICEIVAHHHSPGTLETLNFKVLCDADMLVNLWKKALTVRPADLPALIDRKFLTEKGKKIALRVFRV